MYLLKIKSIVLNEDILLLPITLQSRFIAFGEHDPAYIKAQERAKK